MLLSFSSCPSIKYILQGVFIYTWGSLTKLIPFLCYMFLIPFQDLEYYYWITYILITIINIFILFEVIASYMVLIKEGDTQIRCSDILRAPHINQIESHNPRIRLGIILVGYLPNEIDILPLTIKYLYQKMTFDLSYLFLCLVYNGSDKVKDIKKKEAFQEFLQQQKDNNTNPLIYFSYYDDVLSTSKSENINQGIDILSSIGVNYIGLLDSDHWPHPNTFDIIVKRFQESDHPDVIQGRCCIRRDKSLLSHIVACEFDQIYAIHHLGGSYIRGYGLFCGSNGYWKTQVLKDIRMNKNMLVEDIDASYRAIEKGYKIVYCRSAISTEEAPPSWKSWSKQRTRWAAGWMEITLTHFIKMLKSKKTNLHQKIATFLFLPLREIFEYLSFHTLLTAISFYLRCHSCQSKIMAWLIMLNFVVPFILFYSAIFQGMSGHPLVMKIFYPFISVFYGIMKGSIVMSAHGKLMVGRVRWYITPRKLILD